MHWKSKTQVEKLPHSENSIHFLNKQLHLWNSSADTTIIVFCLLKRYLSYGSIISMQHIHASLHLLFHQKPLSGQRGWHCLFFIAMILYNFTLRDLWYLIHHFRARLLQDRLWNHSTVPSRSLTLLKPNKYQWVIDEYNF